MSSDSIHNEIQASFLTFRIAHDLLSLLASCYFLTGSPILDPLLFFFPVLSNNYFTSNVCTLLFFFIECHALFTCTHAHTYVLYKLIDICSYWHTHLRNWLISYYVSKQSSKPLTILFAMLNSPNFLILGYPSMSGIDP